MGGMLRPALAQAASYRIFVVETGTWRRFERVTAAAPGFPP